jgi:hypothetical protein
MENFDFDQLFTDKMRKAGAPDLSEADWGKLSVRLDHFDQKRQRVLPFWWLGVLTGMLFLSNIMWWVMWQNNSTKMANLQSEWQNARQQNFLKRDTIVNKVIVYQYDTIRVSNRASVAIPNAPFSAGMTTSVNLLHDGHQGAGLVCPGILYQNHPMLPLKDSHIVPGFSFEMITASTGAAKGWRNTKVADQGNNSDTLALISTLPFRVSPVSRIHRIPHLGTQDLPIEHPITQKAPVVSMLWHSRWGISAGTMQAKAKNIAASSGTTFGVVGEMPFSEHWGMKINGNYSLIKLKGYVFDETLGFPPFHSPGAEYDFKYFETHDDSKPVLDLGAGAHYWLSPGKNWSPFIGAEYHAQWHPPYEIEVEFINRNTGTEKSKELEISASASPLSILEVNIGFRYLFARHIHFQVAGYYQIKMNPQQDGIPNYAGLKTAFLYEL